MAFEEVGIRLRTDGAVEATNGMGLVGKALDALSSAAGAAAPELGGVVDAAASAARTMPQMAAAALPVVGVLGAVGVAAGVVAIAWSKGAAEAQAYQRAIIMTGNAAGVTTGQLQAMAGRVDAIVGTHAQAADILARLVATGNVSRDQLQLGTEAAIAMQRSLGVEADKTVAILAKLGKDPLKAVTDLNEQWRFLTLSVYEQIKALTEQGRTAEAAAVAQEATSKAAIERSAQMEKNLGTLQKAWRAVGETAKEAWNWMLGAGRKSTVEEELADVERRLAAPLTRGVTFPAQQQARRQALEERRKILQEQLADQADAARMEAQIARVVQDKVDADKKKPKAERAGAAPADPYKAINDEISRRLVLAGQELSEGQKLTEAERVYLELLERIRAAEAKGGKEAAAAARQRAEGVLRVLQLTEEQRKQAEDEKRLQEEFRKDRAAATQAAEREVVTLQQQRDKLAEETAEIGLNARAVLERRQALIDADIAARQAHIARISGLPAYAEEAAALQQQIELLQQIRNLNAAKVTAQERKAEQEEADRRTKSVYDSIMDGLTNGFRDGRKPGDIFLREFKAMAARTLLKVPVQFLAQAVGGLAGDFTKLLGTVFGGIFGGGGGGGDGGGIDAGTTPVIVAHGGGVAGRMAASRTVNMGLFGGARRMHGGGLAGDEVPAILRKGEGVFTPEQMKALGGSGRTLVMNVTNHIDSRTDAAVVAQNIEQAMQATKAQMLEEMDRGQI